jgi:predicted HAD superfamily Cof-like phosphohydrolase
MVNLVRKFHEAFGHPAPGSPTPPSDPADVRLRGRLITEEYKEVMEQLALLSNAQGQSRKLEIMADLLKELADLRVVLEGTAIVLGLDIDGAFEEVMHSNMTKLGQDGRPILRQDGKILKGPNYQPADMLRFVPPIIEGSADEADA